MLDASRSGREARSARFWRTARGGNGGSKWVDPLVEVLGTNWAELARHKDLWRATRKSFIDVLTDSWQLDQLLIYRGLASVRMWQGAP